MKRLAEVLIQKRAVIFAIIIIFSGICATWISKVNINTDMTKYLSDSSNMKKGINKMEKEFPNQEASQTIRVMFEDLEDTRKEEVVKELEELNYVDTVDYDKESKAYNKDNYTLYVVTTQYEYGSEEEDKLQEMISKKYSEDKVTVIDNGNKATLSIDIVIMALVLMMIVLFVMSRSWIEPFLFLFVIAIAVSINMGTNIFKESVSNTTFSIAAILQLALSMDYSIILMNRYRQEKEKSNNKVEAMTNAVAGAFASVTSSAFTTFVGLLMLVFMNYKLGEDLGIVLAKGVLCSWLCVFTVLPSVILVFDKIILKTTKKSLHVPMDKIASFSYKFKKVMPVVFVLLFIVAYYLQAKTGFMFTTTGEDDISRIFPNNTMVVLYNNEDEAKIEKIVDEVEDDEGVTSVISYPTTIGKQCSSEELADMVGDYAGDTDMDMDASLLNILYYDHHMDGKLPEITVGELINFIADDVVKNETFEEQLDDEMKEQVEDMKKFADKDTLTKKMTIKELSEFFDMEEDDLKSLFVLYYAQKGGVDTGSMTLKTFVNFIINDVMSNEDYSSMFNKDAKEKIGTLKTYVDKEKMTKKMTYKEAAKLLGIDSETVKLLYVYYYANQDDYKPSSMTISTFVDFMINKVAKNKTFSSYFDEDALSQIKSMQKFTKKDKIQEKLNSEKMASFLGMDKSMIDAVYSFYYGVNNNGANAKLTLSEFMNFLVEDVMENQLLAGNFDDSMKSSMTKMSQLIGVAKSGQKMTAGQLAATLGMGEEQVAMLMSMMGTDSMTLPDFTDFMVNQVLANGLDGGMIDETTKASLTMMNQLLQAVVADVKFSASDMASTLGIEAEQVTQLYVFYKGVHTSDKKMSPVQMIEYLLAAKNSGSVIGSAISSDVVKQLTTLQKIMNLTIKGTKLTYSELGKMFGIDSSTMKLLYTLYASYQDTSSWKLSMQTLVNYLVDNSKTFSSMMNKSMLSELKMAQKIINGTVKGTKYSTKSMASLLGMDKKQIIQLYLLYISEYGDTSKWGTSPQKLIHFLVDTVLENKSYADMFDDETEDLLRNAKVIVDAVVSEKKYSASGVTDILDDLVEGIDKNTVELLYLYYGSEHNFDEKWTMSIETLFNHLADEVVNDPRFESFLKDSFKKEIDDMRVQLQEGIDQLVGDNYSIMMLNTTFPEESDETNTFISKLIDVCEENVEEDIYYIGNSVMNYEMKQTFRDEMWLITILTAVSIFIIVALTFKSFMIPAILVLIVQCAVYVTVASSGLRGDPLQFIAYLMVQCILMGATIDYAILFANYYKDNRRRVGIKEALLEAYSGSIHTIFTSGLIIVFVTGVIGVSLKDIIGQTCLTIAVGSAVAILLILFVLPGTIAVFDKMVLRREKKRMQKLEDKTSI